MTVNEDTAQTVLSGMGELHLEIVHDRLVRDYGIECSLGKLQVAYREAPTESVTKEGFTLSDCVLWGFRLVVCILLFKKAVVRVLDLKSCLSCVETALVCLLLFLNTFV